MKRAHHIDAVRPEPTEQKRRDTRKEILAAARWAFIEFGYEGTSLDRIAEKIGISSPALYYHFSSKSDLLSEIMLDGCEELNKRVFSALAPYGRGQSDEMLRAFVREYVSYQLTLLEDAPDSARDLHFSNSFIHALDEDQREAVYEYQRKFVAMLKAILTQGVQDGLMVVENPTVSAFAIIGMVEHLVFWYRKDGTISVDELRHELASAACRLVKAE